MVRRGLVAGRRDVVRGGRSNCAMVFIVVLAKAKIHYPREKFGGDYSLVLQSP